MLRFKFILVCLCAFGSLSATTFHLLMWADTLDSNISRASKIDLSLVHKEALRVALKLGYDLDEVIIDGTELTRVNARNSLDQMQVEGEDIIFFYYTGHGSRGKNKNDKWPEFYLAGSRERMDFSFVKASLSKKNPRFILAIADCCNNFRSQTVKKEIMSLASSGHSQWLANLHTLFLGKTQAVFISAASPGEYAWAYENQGGVFTLSFFEYFRKLLGNTNPITWELILSKVQKDISCFQNPQFEIISY